MNEIDSARDILFEEDMKHTDELNAEYESLRKRAYALLYGSENPNLDEARRIVCRMEDITAELKNIARYWSTYLAKVR